ncbi:MAG: sensor histidine kinase [Nitriliruptorales bacterium]|nr:sensor histidine kinase [Nitriliruptorales bacterium]
MDRPGTSPEALRHAWLRWASVWHGVFAVALGTGAVFALGGEANVIGVLVLTGALGAAYAWVNVLRPASTSTGAVAGLLLLWALWLTATWLHPAFVPVGALLAAHTCYLSVRWAALVASLFVIGIVVREVAVGEGPSASLVGPVVVAATLGLILAAYVAAIARESAGRAALIDRLDATRSDLARAEHERGVLEERGRVARDVHDTLAQAFTSVITQLQAAQVADNSDAEGVHVGRALEAARDGLHEARRIVWDFDDAVPSLEEGLDTLSAAAAKQHLAVEARIVGVPRDVEEEVRRELLAITREALNNVVRHSGCERAEIHLGFGTDRVTLEVADLGRGFDPAATNGGYGLRSMRERAARLGSRLDVQTGPGTGTRISLHVVGA